MIQWFKTKTIALICGFYGNGNNIVSCVFLYVRDYRKIIECIEVNMCIVTSNQMALCYVNVLYI